MGFGGGSRPKIGPSIGDLIAIEQLRLANERRDAPNPGIPNENTSARQARNRNRRSQQSAAGLAGTRVTSPKGLINPAPTQQRTLLGQ